MGQDAHGKISQYLFSVRQAYGKASMELTIITEENPGVQSLLLPFFDYVQPLVDLRW
jgi:hypothetical protein